MEQRENLGFSASEVISTPITLKEAWSEMALLDPINTQNTKSISDDYTRSEYLQLKEAKKAFAHAINRTFKLKSPILEIGCGDATHIETLREEGLDARGIDIAWPFASNKDYVEECKGDGSIKYPDKYFNTILILNVTQHLPVDVLYRYYNECFRVLKKNGIAIVTTPTIPFFTSPDGYIKHHGVWIKYLSLYTHISIIEAAGLGILHHGYLRMRHNTSLRLDSLLLYKP